MGEYSICSRVQHSFRRILKGWRKGLTETLWNITNTSIASWVWDRILLCSSPYWCQNTENSFAEKDLPDKLNTSQQCAGVQKRSPADWAVLVREQTSLQRIQGIFSCIRPFWEHAGVLFLVLGSQYNAVRNRRKPRLLRWCERTWLVQPKERKMKGGERS